MKTTAIKKEVEFTFEIKESEIGGYYAEVLELDGVISYGQTEEELLDNINEGIEMMLACTKQMNQERLDQIKEL